MPRQAMSDLGRSDPARRNTFGHAPRRPRPVSPARLTAALLLLAVVLAGCGSSSSTTSSTSTPPATPTTSAASTPAATPPASSATDLTGTWSGEYSGAYQGSFNLVWQQSGTSLTGTIKLSTPPQTLNIHGTLSGSAITFGTVGSLAITYSGTVSGSTMSGQYTVGGTAGGPWSAHKIS